MRLFLGPAALTAVCVLALLTRESTRKRSITCRTISTTPHVNERKLLHLIDLKITAKQFNMAANKANIQIPW